MTVNEAVVLLDLTLTPEQARACAFLEEHGLRFLIDFGYENAVAKARAGQLALARHWLSSSH